MNYKKLQLINKELFFDADAKRTACKDCGELIRFAQDNQGKYYPINSSGTAFHKCSNSEFKLERNIESENRNQDYLNSL